MNIPSTYNIITAIYLQLLICSMRKVIKEYENSRHLSPLNLEVRVFHVPSSTNTFRTAFFQYVIRAPLHLRIAR